MGLPVKAPQRSATSCCQEVPDSTVSGIKCQKRAQEHCSQAGEENPQSFIPPHLPSGSRLTSGLFEVQILAARDTDALTEDTALLSKGESN